MIEIIIKIMIEIMIHTRIMNSRARIIVLYSISILVLILYIINMYARIMSKSCY